MHCDTHVFGTFVQLEQQNPAQTEKESDAGQAAQKHAPALIGYVRIADGGVVEIIATVSRYDV